MDHVSSQHQHDADDGAGRAVLSRRAARLGFAAFALLAMAGFLALGVWQIERLGWKRALIARVETRLHAAPVPLGEVLQTAVQPEDAYLRVRAKGEFLAGRDTLVQAVTARGPGFWLITPLSTAHGMVLVNRGFVPEAWRDPAKREGPPAITEVTGLLRLSEPGGAFLRTNDPAADRWYSRDVQAIARARSLGPVAPFFLDAEASAGPDSYPVGGLTVVRFPNNHLVYALTWFALAALSGAALVLLVRMDPR